MRRVVITGMGAISALGSGVEPLWAAASSGTSGIRRITFARAVGNHVDLGGEVPGFDPEALLGYPAPRSADRHAQFALVASAEAVAQAGLTPQDLHSARTAAIIGSGVGGISTMDEGCAVYYSGNARLNPWSVPRVMTSSAVSHVSIAHGITGPSFGITSACASATQSIGMAAMMIGSGMIDRALAGGAEACLSAAVMRAWEMLRVLTMDACRPFSADRSGMVIGEGAGVFVLESEEAALARGAVPLAILSGYGTSSDARDMIQPDPDGAEAAMRAALDMAGLPTESVGYVNAHGTGTALNDINEALALRRVFGDALDDVPVSSSKPIVGHALGASGALELAVTVMALRNQRIPPHINLSRPDPKCPLYLPPPGAEGLVRPFEAALSNTFAFGGINASLVVQRVP